MRTVVVSDRMSQTKGLKQGFTLIELLVVIAIIALLAAILFPVFARARENARKTACMNNLKQIGLGVMQYTQDFDESYPPVYVDLTGDNSFSSNIDRGWAELLQPYVKSQQLFQCPSERDRTYSGASGSSSGAYSDYWYNRNIGPSHRPSGGAFDPSANQSDFTHVANTVMIGDGEKATIFNNGSSVNQWYGTDATNARPVASGGTFNTPGKAIIGDSTTTNCLRHLEGANYVFADGHVKWLKGSTGNRPAEIYNPVTPPDGANFTFAIK